MTYEIAGGTEIISRDPPKSLRVANSGFLLPCAKHEAQAIIVDSTVYALGGKGPAPEYPDGGKADELYRARETHTEQISSLERSAIELGNAAGEATAAIMKLQTL